MTTLHLEALQRRWAYFIRLSQQHSRMSQAELQLHREICTAIVDRDADGAEQAMHQVTVRSVDSSQYRYYDRRQQGKRLPNGIQMGLEREAGWKHGTPNPSGHVAI